MLNESLRQNAAATAPLTAFQAALWASHRIEPENTGHNAPLLVQWNCEIDVERFERALSEVVRTTDSLRIVFRQTDGEVIQAALDSFTFKMLRRDFSNHADPKRAAIAWIADIAAQPHDLATTPFRTALARLGDRSWIWLLDQHHILTDYTSKNLILSRLDHFYGPSPGDACPVDDHPRFIPLAHHIRVEDDKDIAPRTKGETSDIFGERIITTSDQPDAGMLVHHFCLTTPDSTSPRSRKEIFDQLGAALIGLVASVTSRRQFQIGLIMNRRNRLQASDCCGPILHTESLNISLADNPTSAEITQEWRRAVLDRKRNPASVTGTDALLEDRVILNFTLDPLADFNGSRSVELSHEIPVRGTNDGIRLTARPGSEKGTIRLILAVSAQMALATGGAKVVAQHLLASHAVLAGEGTNKLSDIDFLNGGGAEHERRLAEAAFQVGSDTPQTIVDAFIRTKTEQPDAIAVSEGDTVLSYRELDDQSRKLAAALWQRSVRPGDVVIVALPRSIDWLVAALAVFRLGAILCPMDATASPERVRAIVEQTRARLRITTSQDWAPEVTATIPELMAQDVLDHPDHRPTGDDCAYLIFTSGSTGMPKGVMIRHHALVRFLDWYRRDVELDASSVFGFTMAPFFDMTCSLFTMFLVGGHIRVYPEETGRLGVVSGLLEDRCTFLFCTPSIATAMLQLPDLRRPTRLQTFSLGGEGFSTHLHARLRAFLGPDVAIVNNYGPTETTVAVATLHLPADPPGGVNGKPFMLPVGKAMPATYFLIMNPEMRPLPPGFVGEICIGGQQLAEGYFERPAETQKAFVQSSSNPDLRLYRTGDVGRLAPDGTLVLFGRADSQLKFNGIRIEPFEVELALMKHPDVIDAAVALRGEPASLCGWYVADRDVAPAELRQIALKSIQPGMFPTNLIRVGNIPRTANGKRNYSALPDPDVAQPVAGPVSPAFPSIPDIAEADVIGQAVVAIWRDVLQRKAAWDVDAGFDDLGGDSLAAMRMIFQVEHLFGIDLDQVNFAEINSVRALSDKIRFIKSEGTKRAPRYADVSPAPDHDAIIQTFLAELRQLLNLWPGTPVGDSGMIRVLNKTGSKVPLVWCFNDSSEPLSLAAALGADQPLFILRSAHGLIDGGVKEFYEAQVAEIYARAILATVGPAPVVIGGNCQGSRIALMVANTLLHLKIDVATVLLVEPAFLVPYPRRVMLMPGTNYSRINPLFSYGNPQLGWSRYFRDYRAAMIRGGHGEYFRPENVGSLADVVKGEMQAALQKPALRAADIENAVELTISATPQPWQAGAPDVVEVQLSTRDGYTLVMNEESGITVSFRWDCALPLVELPRPASSFPSRRILRGGETAHERFSVQPPRAKGRYTLTVQLCEEGVRYLGAPARMVVDLC